MASPAPPRPLRRPYGPGIRGYTPAPLQAAAAVAAPQVRWRVSCASFAYSSSPRGGASGGARPGRPRQPRIAAAASGGRRAEITRVRAPQRGHASTSIANTRWSGSAQLIRLARPMSGASSRKAMGLANSAAGGDSRAGGSPRAPFSPSTAVAAACAGIAGGAALIWIGLALARQAAQLSRGRHEGVPAHRVRRRRGSARCENAAEGSARRASRRAPGARAGCGWFHRASDARAGRGVARRPSARAALTFLAACARSAGSERVPRRRLRNRGHRPSDSPRWRVGRRCSPRPCCPRRDARFRRRGWPRA